MLRCKVRNADAIIDHVHDPSIHLRIGAKVLLEIWIELAKVHVSNWPWSKWTRSWCLTRPQARSYMLSREWPTLEVVLWRWETILHANLVAAHARSKLVVPTEHLALMLQLHE